MISYKKPALRHFAVIKRVKASSYGYLWLVKDRRGDGRNQLLLVPGKRRAWPLLLSCLADNDVTPVRLRNTRVALLITGSDVKVVTAALRASKGQSVVLNAVSGFEPSKRSAKKKFIFSLGGAVLLLLCVAMFPSTTPTTATVIEPQPSKASLVSCGEHLKVGQEVIGSTKKLKRVSIEQIDFLVASNQKLGGLLQLKLKRLCDEKYFRVDAWAGVDQVLIAKVY